MKQAISAMILFLMAALLLYCCIQTRSSLLENGTDIEVIQTLLACSSLATTEIYTHVSTKKIKTVPGQTQPMA